MWLVTVEVLRRDSGWVGILKLDVWKPGYSAVAVIGDSRYIQRTYQVHRGMSVKVSACVN